jgi:hypothetical protein
MNGDVTISNTGATTIVPNAVTSAKIADSNVTNAKLQNSSITINGNTVDLGGTATINASPIGSALTSGNIIVGDTAGVAAEVTMNGDVTITNAGVTVIGTGKVNDVKLDKTNIPLSGFGAALAAVDLGSNKLTNVTDPTLAQDAATKNYVDSATSTITTLADGKIYIGSASNVAAEVSMNGDVSINNLGSTTIAPNAVTYSKFQNVSTTDKVLGRVSPGSGVIEEIATTGTGDVVRANSPILTGAPILPTGTTGVTQIAGNNTTALATTEFVSTANLTNANLTGPITSIGNATTITNAVVTYNKIQDVNNDKVLGNFSGATGSVQELATTGTGDVVRANSPILTGTPSLPTGTTGVTQIAGNNSTALATTEFVSTANLTNANLTGPITSIGNATTITDAAVTSAKILDETIKNEDISHTAAIQTTKIKGFYTGIYKINVSSNGGTINIPVGTVPNGLNINGGVTENSTIIFQSQISNLYVKYAKPIDISSDNTTYENISVGFKVDSPATNFSGDLIFSYIIILNN